MWIGSSPASSKRRAAPRRSGDVALGERVGRIPTRHQNGSGDEIPGPCRPRSHSPSPRGALPEGDLVELAADAVQITPARGGQEGEGALIEREAPGGRHRPDLRHQLFEGGRVPRRAESDADAGLGEHLVELPLPVELRRADDQVAVAPRTRGVRGERLGVPLESRDVPQEDDPPCGEHSGHPCRSDERPGRDGIVSEDGKPERVGLLRDQARKDRRLRLVEMIEIVAGEHGESRRPAALELGEGDLQRRASPRPVVPRGERHQNPSVIDTVSVLAAPRASPSSAVVSRSK